MRSEGPIVLTVKKPMGLDQRTPGMQKVVTVNVPIKLQSKKVLLGGWKSSAKDVHCLQGVFGLGSRTAEKVQVADVHLEKPRSWKAFL